MNRAYFNHVYVQPTLFLRARSQQKALEAVTVSIVPYGDYVPIDLVPIEAAFLEEISRQQMSRQALSKIAQAGFLAGVKYAKEFNQKEK
ncbi:MAG: hypothetical protein HY094_09395 [Candidatus Melainabacteria bacterium]|nr:hypothetical protein [Candidatus Melainabacteria bacterium]